MSVGPIEQTLQAYGTVTYTLPDILSYILIILSITCVFLLGVYLGTRIERRRYKT